MSIAISKRSALTAASLVVLHILALIYVQARDVLYDQGGVQGLLWFTVNLWLLPILALMVLVLSAVRHRHDPENSEY